MKKTSLISLEICRIDKKYEIYQNFYWVHETNFSYLLQSGRCSLEEGWIHPLHAVKYSAGVTHDIKHIYSYYIECIGIYWIFTSFQASHPSFEWEHPTTGVFPLFQTHWQKAGWQWREDVHAIHFHHASKGTEAGQEGEIICASKRINGIYFHSGTMREQKWNCTCQNSVWGQNR